MTRRRAGVRGRLTAVAAVATLLTLAVTVAAGLVLLRRSLVDQLDDSLRNRAEDTVERLAEVGGSSLAIDDVPIPFGGDDTFAAVWDDTGIVTRNEVLDDGHLADLEDLDGSTVTMALPEVTDLAGADRMRIAVASLDGLAISWDDPAAVQRAPAATGAAETSAGSTVFVAIGVSLDDIDRLVRTIGLAGAGLTLVLTVLAAALVWTATGRALRPVDRLRSEAEAITASALDRRLVAERPDELGRLATTLNGMLDRLEQSQHAQRRFVSDASHELRNPVAAVGASLEVGLRDPAGTDWPVVAQESLVGVRRVRRLIDDLLVLARADEGGLSVARELVDLDDVVLAEVRSARAVTPAPIDTSAISAAAVVGDPMRLGQVVANLLANAGRHARGQVAVSVADRAGSAWVCVDDDGPGVPESERTQIFERFTRLDESRRRDSGGAGLGLAICREIVVAHGGDIGVGDSPLGGARFWFRLPTSLA